MAGSMVMFLLTSAFFCTNERGLRDIGENGNGPYEISGCVGIRSKSRPAEFENCIVFITPKSGEAHREKEYPPVTVSLEDHLKAPFHVCVLTGQQIVIKWKETSIHHLQPFGNKAVAPMHGQTSIGYYAEIFATPDDGIAIKCMLERKVVGYVTVVCSPNWTRAGSKGKFIIPNVVETGFYTITAYHPSYGRISREIRVEGSIADLNLVFDAAKEK